MAFLDGIVRILGKPFGVARYRVKNDIELEAAIPIMRDFLAQAKNSIRIASGEMNHRVYNHPEIVNILKQLCENGVDIEIVHSPLLDSQTVEIPEMARKGKLKMFKLPASQPPHFWLIDEKQVLDENEHSRGQPDREFYLVDNGAFLADALRREFIKRKNEATPTFLK